MLVFYVSVFLCAASCVMNDDDDDRRQLSGAGIPRELSFSAHNVSHPHICTKCSSLALYLMATVLVN